MRKRTIFIVASIMVAAARAEAPTPVQGGANDAGFDGESWVSNGTTLTASASSSAWLQFDLYLPRNTAIQSATLTVVPSSTSIIVPGIVRVSYAALFFGTLSTDQSSLLASLTAESQPGFATWTAGEPVALDVTETLQSWLQDANVPDDDSGAYCTLVARLGAMELGSYSLAAFEHATLAAATLTIVLAPANQFEGESGLHYAPVAVTVEGETGLHRGGATFEGESGLHYKP